MIISFYISHCSKCKFIKSKRLFFENCEAFCCIDTFKLGFKDLCFLTL